MLIHGASNVNNFFCAKKEAVYAGNSHFIASYFGDNFMTFTRGSKSVGIATRLQAVQLRRKRFLGAFTKLRKATIIFVTFDRPSSWNNSTPTGRIFVKFDTWVFFENLSRNSSFINM
jgi:hypothetical protein